MNVLRQTFVECTEDRWCPQTLKMAPRRPTFHNSVLSRCARSKSCAPPAGRLPTDTFVENASAVQHVAEICWRLDPIVFTLTLFKPPSGKLGSNFAKPKYDGYTSGMICELKHSAIADDSKKNDNWICRSCSAKFGSAFSDYYIRKCFRVCIRKIAFAKMIHPRTPKEIASDFRRCPEF